MPCQSEVYGRGRILNGILNAEVRRLGAQQCLTGARHTVAERTPAAQRRRRGGRKGALELLSVQPARLEQLMGALTSDGHIPLEDTL